MISKLFREIYEDIVRYYLTFIDKRISSYIKFLHKFEYVDHEGQPIKCIHCRSTNLIEKTTDSIDFLVVEKDSICKDCSKVTGNWSYGFWQA